jgi:hypothetical protein
MLIYNLEEREESGLSYQDTPMGAKFEYRSSIKPHGSLAQGNIGEQPASFEKQYIAGRS